MSIRNCAISLLVILALLTLEVPAVAESVKIYAKDFTSCADTGFNPITVSNGWVHGVDCPGDWVEYGFSLSGYGINDTRLTAMGTQDQAFSLTMSVTGTFSGMTQEISFDFIGSGFEG